MVILLVLARNVGDREEVFTVEVNSLAPPHPFSSTKVSHYSSSVVDRNGSDDDGITVFMCKGAP